MDAHPVGEPAFGHRRLAAGLPKVEQAAARAVGGRHEERSIRGVPHGRADVETPLRLVRVAPETTPVARIQADDLVATEDDQLGLAVDVDQDRRRRRRREVAGLPGELTRRLAERHDRLAGAAGRDDDEIAVGEWAARVTAAGTRRVVLLDQVVRPQALSRGLVEREDLLQRARRARASTDGAGRPPASSSRGSTARARSCVRGRPIAAMPRRSPLASVPASASTPRQS